MAKKPKYNPEDVERWVTVRGARIPILKDGSFGIGEKETNISAKSFNKMVTNLKEQGLYIAENGKTDPIPKDGSKYPIYDENAKKYYDGVYHTDGKNHSMTVNKSDNQKAKPTSRNAKYDTSKTQKGIVADAYDKVEKAKQAWNKASDESIKISHKLRNEYLKKKYGVTYSQMEKKGAYTSKIRQAVDKYVESNSDYRKARQTEEKLMGEHAKTTAILKKEYKKYRDAGGIQNADWYRASIEWDNYD